MKFLNSLLPCILILISVTSELLAADDDCKDTSDKCADWQKNKFCENCFYSCDVRIQYCAKTCGFCGDNKVDCKDCTVTTTPTPSTTTTPPSTTTGPCFDMVDNCKNWKLKGFCTNPFYKCADKIKYCAKSCGFCGYGSCVDN